MFVVLHPKFSTENACDEKSLIFYGKKSVANDISIVWRTFLHIFYVSLCRKIVVNRFFSDLNCRCSYFALPTVLGRGQVFDMLHTMSTVCTRCQHARSQRLATISCQPFTDEKSLPTGCNRLTTRLNDTYDKEALFFD